MPDDEYVDAMRDGVKVAASRGVTCLHDKDGWLGAIGLWQRLEEQGGLHAPRVAVDARRASCRRLRELSLRSGVGSPLLRVGYLKMFMDGTLGSQTAWMTRRQRRRDHERRGARGDRARGRGGRLAGRRARDRRRARTARRSTRSSGRATRGAPRACASGSSTRSASRPTTSRASRSSAIAVSAQFSHAPSDEHLAKRFWADRLDGDVLVPLAARLGRARRERLRRAGRGARPVGGRRRRPSSTTGARTSGSRSSRRSTRPASRRRGSRTTSASAARSSPAATPISSCSTATRSPASRRSCREVQVVATMLGGRWTHNPPPWDLAPHAFPVAKRADRFAMIATCRRARSTIFARTPTTTRGTTRSSRRSRSSPARAVQLHVRDASDEQIHERLGRRGRRRARLLAREPGQRPGLRQGRRAGRRARGRAARVPAAGLGLDGDHPRLRPARGRVPRAVAADLRGRAGARARSASRSA